MITFVPQIVFVFLNLAPGKMGMFGIFYFGSAHKKNTRPAVNELLLSKLIRTVSMETFRQMSLAKSAEPRCRPYGGTKKKQQLMIGRRIKDGGCVADLFIRAIHLVEGQVQLATKQLSLTNVCTSSWAISQDRPTNKSEQLGIGCGRDFLVRFF